ncbi:MAG: hypothetical protein AABM67_11170 [Acidobacteriota bacterium]
MRKLSKLASAALLLVFSLVGVNAQTKPTDGDPPRFEVGGHVYGLGTTGAAPRLNERSTNSHESTRILQIEFANDKRKIGWWWALESNRSRPGRQIPYFRANIT